MVKTEKDNLAKTAETNISPSENQPENPTQTKPPKKSHLAPKICGAIFGALLLIGASAGLTCLIMKNQPAETAEPSEEITQVIVTEDGQEVEMTKFDVIAQLAGRMDVFRDSYALRHSVYVMELFRGNLSDEGKLYFTLASLEKDGNIVKMSIQEVDTIAEKYFSSDNQEFWEDAKANNNTNFYDYRWVDVEVVAERYHELFGEDFDLTRWESGGVVGNCGGYGYISSERKFMAPLATECGGGGPSIDWYSYNYELDGDQAYVYTAAATIMVEDFDICPYSYPVYPEVIDWYDDEQTSATDYTCESGWGSAGLVNNSTYEKYAKYKFTFRKSGDSYYFDNVTKL